MTQIQPDAILIGPFWPEIKFGNNPEITNNPPWLM